jgi:transcriptional regulator with XRE-family HTH domain
MRKQRCNKGLLLKIAQRIKQLREEKSISQEVFYIDTDIHIARIETGKLNITVSTLQAICDYFEISLLDFFKDVK